MRNIQGIIKDLPKLSARIGAIVVGGVGADFVPGHTLILDPETGVLEVNTTNIAEENNTLPITSAGVNTIVGNIGAILDTI